MCTERQLYAMADHAEDDNDESHYVYRGGRAPQHVTHVLIDKSVDDIEDDAFYNCERLVKVETHDGIRKVGRMAFRNCTSLSQINLKSVIEIDEWAFCWCKNLVDVEFGDELETIGYRAFSYCVSLKHLKFPSVVTIGSHAFSGCEAMTDIELSERLETIEGFAFSLCKCLRRIAIPLKRDLFPFDGDMRMYTQFRECDQLVTVELVGGIDKTVASLHMESWRTQMIAEFNRINEVLPNTSTTQKTNVLRQWMESALDEMDRYKTEHCRYVKEGITLLELALWKAALGENEEPAGERRTKKFKVDAESERKERRIKCGADIVIKNVLPFLQLLE